MLIRGLSSIYRLLRRADQIRQDRDYRRRFKIDPTARLGYEVALVGNIEIGAHSYVNSGQLISGSRSKIVIGRWCAIGYNVNILASTHDVENPTGAGRAIVEEDIVIEDGVWIGSNVLIREGCHIGSHSIIGANSVVTRDIPAYSIVAGLPGRLIGQRDPSQRDISCRADERGDRP